MGVRVLRLPRPCSPPHHLRTPACTGLSSTEGLSASRTPALCWTQTLKRLGTGQAPGGRWAMEEEEVGAKLGHPVVTLGPGPPMFSWVA